MIGPSRCAKLCTHQATAAAGSPEAIFLRAASIISSGFPGGIASCTTILTGPLYMRPSCPLGMSLPVPTRVTGTTGTFALEATENAPCVAAQALMNTAINPARHCCTSGKHKMRMHAEGAE